jgi:aspartyl/asparaginyl beta-hydroxylase (cupin superfamily)
MPPPDELAAQTAKLEALKAKMKQMRRDLANRAPTQDRTHPTDYFALPARLSRGWSMFRSRTWTNEHVTLRVFQKLSIAWITTLLAFYSFFLWLLGCLGLISTPSFLAKNTFGWEEAVTEDVKVMRREAITLAQFKKLIPPAEFINPLRRVYTRDGRWRTLYLRVGGRDIDTNGLLVPSIAKAVNKATGCRTAYLSFLAKGKHVPAHRGDNRGLVYTHVGLFGPDHKACGIRAHTSTHHLKEGQVVCVDGACEKEYWNDTLLDKIELVVVNPKPLPFPLSLLNRLVLGVVGCFNRSHVQIQRIEDASQTLVRAFAEHGEFVRSQ